MEDAEHDDEEDHLEEGDEEVGGGKGEAENAQDGRTCALELDRIV